jgi:hypothetical protein
MFTGLPTLDIAILICHHFRMGFFSRIFRRKQTFAMQPSDLKMWQASATSNIMPHCECLGIHQNGKKEYSENLSFHKEAQDTTCEAWMRLKSLVEKAASDHTLEFAPGLEMPPEQCAQIITLPSSIRKLTSVKKLYLYGSHLVRIPEEIGNMSNLEELDLYTSYRLHWLPFEVTRCLKLKRTRFSTRALYGNYKYRSPFPKLDFPDENIVPEFARCSVCNVCFR